MISLKHYIKDGFFNEDFTMGTNIITKNVINTKEDLYDYLINAYDFNNINDFKNHTSCPKKLDLNNVIVSQDINTEELFTGFLCEEIDISSWDISKIGKKMFYNCFTIKSIILPNDITEIGNNAFNGCTKLKEIKLPSSIKDLGESVFSHCWNLKNIIIPNQVSELKKFLFWGTSALECIHIPSSVSKIDNTSIPPINLRTNHLTIKTPKSNVKTLQRLFNTIKRFDVVTIIQPE